MNNINDFEIQDGVLIRYNGSDAEVVIPAGVTIIGEEAFRGNESLESVTIPEGVSRIERKAFENCHNLTSITLPNSVTSIGSGAFDDYVIGGGVKTKNIYAGDLLNYLKIKFDLAAWDKINLYFNGELATDLTIPDGVTSIGQYAFWDCQSLKSVWIPDSVTHIGSQAFDLCSQLDAVYCNSIKSWCNIAFDDNPLSQAERFIVNGEELTDLVIPDGVTSIGRNAFSGYKQLKSVIIPDSVESIDYAAFQDCSNLSSVTIPDSVKSIEDWAFCRCESLSDIDLPDSVSYLGENAFCSCDSLSSIKIPGGVTKISEGAFEYCGNMTSVTIPDGVKSIGHQSFGKCSSLKSVTLPDSMNQFDEDYYKWGNFIFDVNTVVILNHYIKDIEKKNVSKRLVFCKTPIQEIKSTNAKDLAVKGFLTVEDLSVYDDVVVESYKKYLKPKVVNYVYFILENDVERIVRRLALLGLIDSKLSEKLMENDLSDEIKALLVERTKEDEKRGGNRKATSNKAPSVTELKKIWSFKKNEEGITITSYKGVDIKVIVPEKIGKDAVTEIGDEAFSAWKNGINEKLVQARKNITEITIPDSVSAIGRSAFSGCINLCSISIPNTITDIGYRAFRGCVNLTEVVLPEGVTAIGNDTFASCKSLTNISIPNTVERIGNHAFNECSNLKCIILSNKLEEIENSLFNNCSSLEAITIPDRVSKIDSDAFRGCKSLKSVSMPDSVTSIGPAAFFACSSLVSINLPRDVERVWSYTFFRCSSLTDATIQGSSTIVDEKAFMECNNLTIHAPAGSCAEEYAKEINIPFEEL